ncbi:cytochrome P450 9e2 [Anabrus simplex]|uniref:cytochrome P450 9e2 n=1 Tax=Anabrus simplex TaxID=316456 RepID=UPI0035A2AFA8
MSIVNAVGIPVALPDWVLATGALLLLFYVYATWTYDVFKKRKIPFLQPLPMVGNMKSTLFRSQSISEFVRDTYTKMKGHRISGIYEFRNPLFFIRDPEIVKQVCVKDFDHFMNHRKAVSEKTDPFFSKSLFGLQDKRWRDMRSTLSPAFTSSKMKAMFLLISECGRQTREYLEERCREQPGGPDTVLTIEMKDFFTRFATDVIATSAFGVKCDSLKQPKNEFYLMGKEITTMTKIKSLVMMLYVIMPKLAEVLRISFFSKEASQFFSSLVHDTIATREREKIVRPDMIHLMKEASKAGEIDSDKIKLDEDDIAAQAILFFFAGFETVTTLICFSTYLLAIHTDAQERLQREIDSVLEEHNGELSYEALQKMKYLDMVVNETLRMYPPVGAVDRACVRPLTIPATDTQPEIAFQKGDIIWIPIIGLHYDPAYFPEPEKFDPERFSEERKDSIIPFTYMPFGLGPRMCLANRFALMEAKVALVYLLSHFSLHVVDKTPIPMRYSTATFTNTSATGFSIGVSLRNSEKSK